MDISDLQTDKRKLEDSLMKQINEFLDTYKDLGIYLDQVDVCTFTIKQLTRPETTLVSNLELKLSIK